MIEGAALGGPVGVGTVVGAGDVGVAGTVVGAGGVGVAGTVVGAGGVGVAVGVGTEVGGVGSDVGVGGEIVWMKSVKWVVRQRLPFTSRPSLSHVLVAGFQYLHTWAAAAELLYASVAAKFTKRARPP